MPRSSLSTDFSRESVEQRRRRNRLEYRNEQSNPNVRLATFFEIQKQEDRAEEAARERDLSELKVEVGGRSTYVAAPWNNDKRGAYVLHEFERPPKEIADEQALERQRASLGKDRVADEAVIQRFLRRMRRHLEKQMMEKGGTMFSIIRAAFLNWDADNSGELSLHELKGAMRTIGMPTSDRELMEVIKYYDLEGDGEIKYQKLVKDATEGCKSILCHPSTASSRFRKNRGISTRSHASPGEGGGGGGNGGYGSARSIDSLYTARATKKRPNAVVERFKVQLRNQLERLMSSIGGTVHSIIREAFIFWDGDSSGELNAREFLGAMSRIGLNVTPEVAEAVTRYYDVDGDGEMRYDRLVQEVAKGARHFLSHPETARNAQPFYSSASSRMPPPASSPSPAARPHGSSGGASLPGGYRMPSSRPLTRSAMPGVVRRFQERLGSVANQVASQGHPGAAPVDLGGGRQVLASALKAHESIPGWIGARGIQEAAKRKLGLAVTDRDASYVVGWYDAWQKGLMPWKQLVKDVFGGGGTVSAIGGPRVATASLMVPMNHTQRSVGGDSGTFGGHQFLALPNLPSEERSDDAKNERRKQRRGARRGGQHKSKRKQAAMLRERSRIQSRLREIERQEQAAAANGAV